MPFAASSASGVPLLPSGLLYDRGLAYSYASWVAGAVTGSELPAYRALSLACAALIVWLTFLLVARSSPVNAALVASLLVTTSVPFWATATSGRFYAPFLAAFLAVQLALSTLRTTCTPRTLCTVVVLSALARWTHELAFLCAAVPAFFWITSRGDRRRWLLGTIAVGAGLLAAQAAIFALHYFAPSSGETMVRRFFLWQVLNLFERPGGSPVHDPARRDGDCVDRRSCPRAAGVGDCVVVVGDDPDLLGGARDQQRAAVA